MSWFAKRLGNGMFGVLDCNDPTSPPMVTPYPVNKTQQVNGTIDTLANFGVGSLLYSPTVAAKVKSLIISSHNECKVEILYGTTGAQTLISRFWTKAVIDTLVIDFNYFPVSATQTFQVLIWNEYTVAQLVSVTLLACE